MINKKIIQDLELDLFKGQGELCSVFGEPNEKSCTCKQCQIETLDLYCDCKFAEYYKTTHNLSQKEWENIIFNNMETKEVKIEVPKGYEIDKENSTFECIKFKPTRSWRNTVDEHAIVKGWFVDYTGRIQKVNYAEKRNKLFATEKYAKSALAMAQISQIMANDERFGGVVTDKEWEHDNCKYCIYKYENKIDVTWTRQIYYFLTFHTSEQRDLFIKENEDLVKDYLMID